MARMPSALRVAPLALLLNHATADPSLEQGACNFTNEPLFPGYFWDPSCAMGDEGCFADEHSVECRFCGGGEGSGFGTACPPSACHFHHGEPFVPYYWDPTCEAGKTGCWADGLHEECRFCGHEPYTGVECPEGLAAPPNGAECTFDEEPETPYFWDPSCREGKRGCLADGIHPQCRWCGVGRYSNIPCPASRACSFKVEPTVPYFWDPDCEEGMLGCKADGLHPQCRFCAKRPFESVECPPGVLPQRKRCSFPAGIRVTTPHYWDDDCKVGMLGCWADGLHEECRFCGEGVYENVTCPRGLAAPAQWSGEAHAGDRFV